ncbi:MAG TPA: hypothetical protein VJ927_11815 [Actinomycetota bacterium]|nr:hypothetical protein [Actinomycetota bacterium]
MARGPQFHRLVTGAMTAALAAVLLQLIPATALAGEDASNAPIDGFAAGAMSGSGSGPERPTDGWAHRSTPETPKDGFEVARIELPRPEPVTDGWAYRSTPQVKDGFEVARIELPQPDSVTDGWAYRSDAAGQDLASLDGWAYGTVTNPGTTQDPPAAPAPPRSSSPPYAEIAVAAALALLAVAGASLLHYRHQHHLPV